jgi:hypothetical protein
VSVYTTREAALSRLEMSRSPARLDRACLRRFARAAVVGATSAALSLGLFGACGNEVTPVPPGVAALEVNTASDPTGTAADPHPETLEMLTGQGDGYEWVHAKGFVKRPIAEVWAAFQVPEVVVDRRKVARWTVARDVDSSVDVSFVIGNTVEDVIDVFFEITWRQSVVDGTIEDPERVAMRFDKTFGTVFIEILRGSIELTPVDDDTTRVALIEHLDAAQGGIDNALTYLRDLHGSVAAKAAGRPLPTYGE